MKKIIYLISFLPLLLFAGLDISKINNTLLSLSSSSKLLKFYNASSDIRMKEKLTFTSIDNADIILFPSKNLKINKLQIVNSYKELRENLKNIGAIYLRKERTQIVFIKERLEENSLVLPKKYKKHIITECQLNPICLLMY